MSSSVSDDLPAPPVPVMPSTGVGLACSCSAFSSPAAARPFSSVVMSRASWRQACSLWPAIESSEQGAAPARFWSQRITIPPIIPARPMRCPSSGL
jgi:hypothetical protein